MPPSSFRRAFAAQRKADRQNAVFRELGIEPGDQCGEVAAAAGMILLSAKRARQACTPLVDPENRIVAREKERRRDRHVAAVLGAGDAVHQNHQRPIAGANRTVEGSDHMIAAAILQRNDQPLAALNGQRFARLKRVVAQGLQITAPPGTARAETRCKVENSAHVTATLDRQKAQKVRPLLRKRMQRPWQPIQNL